MKKLTIAIFLLWIPFCPAHASENLCGPVYVGERDITKAMGTEVHLIQNALFSGIEQYTLDGQIYYGVAGRYDQPRNGKTLVVFIISCKKGRLVQDAKFEFYGDSLDFLRYQEKSKRLYVVFKDETELFGWIKRVGSNFEFEMFEDPEL